MLRTKGIQVNDQYAAKVVELVRDRSDFISQFWDQSYFFFESPSSYDMEIVRKKWKEDTPDLLHDFKAALSEIDDWKAENIKAYAESFVQAKGIGLGPLMNPLRLCLVGGSFGPDLSVICELLGREEVEARIQKALDFIIQQIK
jgi:glutamyl-tRNA synthetase